MEKEIGRWIGADGKTRVRYEEPLQGDFGQRQIIKILDQDDGLSLTKEATNKQTPGEVIASIGGTAVNDIPEQSDTEL